MTGLFGFRQRAEQFAALVDGRAGDAGSHAGEPAGSPSPRHHPDQERWLSVVSQLRAQDELVTASLPAPAYAASLREALVAEAATVLTSGPTTAERSTVPEEASDTGGRAPLLGRPRRLVAAATVAVVVTGSAGMASAAQTALPGEALYPVKRGLERVDVTLSSSAVGRGRDLLGQASTRLGEVEGLLASGSATAALEVPGTLRTFTWQAREGAAAMMEAYRQTADPRAIAEVRSFASDSMETLESFSGSAPEDDSTGLDAALSAAAQKVQDVDEEATDTCETCSETEDVVVPSVLLASSEGTVDEDDSPLTGGAVLGPLVGGNAPTDPLAEESRTPDPVTDDPTTGDQTGVDLVGGDLTGGDPLDGGDTAGPDPAGASGGAEPSDGATSADEAGDGASDGASDDETSDDGAGDDPTSVDATDEGDDGTSAGDPDGTPIGEPTDGGDSTDGTDESPPPAPTSPPATVPEPVQSTAPGTGLGTDPVTVPPSTPSVSESVTTAPSSPEDDATLAGDDSTWDQPGDDLSTDGSDAPSQDDVSGASLASGATAGTVLQTACRSGGVAGRLDGPPAGLV